MMKSGPKHMKIKLDVDTCKLVKVVDDADTDATVVTQDEMNGIYQSTGFRHVGTILQVRSSPGCMYLTIGDRNYKICS